jgi:ABC-type Zn uptake system ZnuABC Zn-binding protein ZnuA
MARPFVAVLVAFGLVGVACRRAPAPEPVRAVIAASIFPVFDVVRRVAGEAADVALVLPPGHMDHGFEPRPHDLARLSAVEVAFGVGLGLDPWLQRVLAASTDGRARVVELGGALDPRFRAEGGPDPHVFLDPERMARAALLVAESLAARDPGGRDGYAARGSKVAAELRALDAEIRERAAGFSKRAIVTFHGSFFYFAERYGLEVAAVVEPSPGREPSPRDLADVLRAVRERRAAALFSEPQLDSRPARTLAAEAGLPLFELDPIGGGPGASTYEALMRKNVLVLEEALR